MTDGIGWSNKTYHFTTGKAPVTDPFSQGWLYRKIITINHSQVFGILSGFPVLINISADADLASHAQSDGDDIIFMDGDGVANQLPHEIEYYNAYYWSTDCMGQCLNSVFYCGYNHLYVLWK